MNHRTMIVAAIFASGVALSGLALSTSATQLPVCQDLNASWGTFNLLQAQQALRVLAALITAC